MRIETGRLRGLSLLAVACLAFRLGKLDRAFVYAQRATALNPNSPPSQRLLNRIRLARGLPGWTEDDEADLAQRFCEWPFTKFEIRENGNVYVCCPAWLSTPIGNAYRRPVEKIWNSATAQRVRESILDGSFSFCSRANCPKILNRRLPFRDAITGEFERQIMDRHLTVLATGPREVKLNHDRSCNLACPSCRTAPYVAQGRAKQRLERVAESVVLPLLKTASLVEITGSGDPFASQHFRRVLKRINVQDFPHLKIDLATNGILFDEHSWRQLELEGLCRNAVISVDAATERTYSVVRKGGDFNRLLRNLGFIAGLRENGELARVSLVFVAQKDNFLEIPEFIQLTKSFGFDAACFLMIAPWSQSRKDYERRDVGFSAHPQHREFLQVLRDPSLSDDIVELGTMKPFYDEANLDGALPRRSARLPARG